METHAKNRGISLNAVTWGVITETCDVEERTHCGITSMYVSCKGADVSQTETCEGGINHRKCPAKSPLFQGPILIIGGSVINRGYPV